MADLYSILQDPNYTGANLETKTAIFDKYASQNPDYTGANPATQAAIRTKYGLVPPKEKGMLERGLGYAGDVATNLPGSTLGVVKNVAKALWSPLDTLTGAVNVGAGALQNALPSGVVDFVNKFDANDPAAVESAKQAITAANAAGGQLKHDYGSWDKFTETLRRDPAKVLLDASMLLGGAGSVARMGGRAAEGGSAAAGAFNKTANALDTAASYTNPLTPVMKVGTFGVNLGRNALAAAKDPRGYLYRNAIGDRGPQVMNSLNAFKETVPGIKSTIGQASVGSGAGDLNALSAGILDSSTNARNAGLARTQANRAAAEGQVAGVAGTEAELATKIGQRDAQAQANYGLSKDEVVTADKTFNALLGRPSMDRVLTIAKRIADEKGLPFSGGKGTAAKQEGVMLDASGKPKMSEATLADFTGSDLHIMKMAFDEILNKPIGAADALGAAEASAVKGTKQAFIDWVEQKIPAYKIAREEYATASKPIDQMKVAQELQKKMRGPLGSVTPANYNSALINESNLIKEATGTNRYEKISELFPADMKAKLDAVKERFVLEAEDKRLAAGGDAAEGVKAFKIPWGLSSKVALANKIVLALVGKINKKVAMDMAADMLDVPRGTAAIEKALKKRMIIDIPTSTVRSSSAAIINNLAPASQNNLGASE
jgi:hypothetical protein